MDKAERREKSRVAQGSLEIAAAAVNHAERVAGELINQKDALKIHDAIGKLQMKLRSIYEKAKP